MSAPAAWPETTRAAPHVRDGLDVHLATTALCLALLPAAAVGVGNAGFQALSEAAQRGLATAPGWRGALLSALGLPADPSSLAACLVWGLACALPLAVVVAGVGRAWVALFARVRGRRPSTSFPAVAALFVLMLPPGIPAWQAALGISFAVVVGLEIFGGTGRNVVHPAVAGVAFLYFAYPASFADGAWVALDGAGSPPALAHAREGGLAAIEAAGLSWTDTVLGLQPGALGETSALACLVGGVALLATGLASWRTVAGGLLGLGGTVALVHALGDPARPAVGLPAHWHATLGGFAFALFFLATDPVTSAHTRAGRWACGAWLGFFVVLVRVFNPAHRDGVLMAVLLGNVLAPLFDHGAVRWHVWRRRRRLG